MRISRSKPKRTHRWVAFIRATVILAFISGLALTAAWFWYGIEDETAAPTIAAIYDEYPQDNLTRTPPPSQTGLQGAFGGANIRATPLERPNFTYAKPENPSPAADDHFADAIFFGDALTAAIPFYNMAPGAGVVAFAGESPASAGMRTLTSADETWSLPEAARVIYGERSNIYIKFSVASMSAEIERFITEYERFIYLVRESFPQANIFIQTIPPITYAASLSHPFATNEMINEYNIALMNLARQKGVFFLDVAYVLTDDTGHLYPRAAPADGIHISAEFYYIWFDYLRRHW